MSRPIYEPSLARADQALAWGSRQLFRRPAPSSEANIDSAYMLWNEFEEIDSGGGVTNLENYLLGVDGQTIFPNLIEGRFDITLTGVYLVQAVHMWIDSFVGDKMARIQSIVTNAIQDTTYWEAWASNAGNSPNGVDMVTVEALVFVDNIVGLVEGFDSKVFQDSGSPQTLAAVDFSCVRLGDFINGGSSS